MAEGPALVLANRVTRPLDDGWKVRTEHVVRAVAAAYDVRYLAFADEAGPARAMAEALGPRVEVRTVAPPPRNGPLRLAAGLVGPTPLPVLNQRSSAYAALVRAAAAEARPALAVLATGLMSPYVRELGAGVPVVVDTHNVDSLVLARYARTLASPARRLYAAVTARKLRRHEAATFRGSDLVWVCSDAEVPLVHDLAPEARVEVMPNGVDTAAMRPDPAASREPGTVVFFGRLDYTPNADALAHLAHEILPLLRAAGRRVRVRVAGPGTTAALERLAAATPELELLGRVDDLRPLLATAGAVVVPLRSGGGTRLKILEALAMECAVVSTTVGAEGLALVDGRDVLLADDAAAFARAMMRVLDDAALARRLGASGRRLVVERYDWAAIRARMTASLEALRQRHTSQRRRMP